MSVDDLDVGEVCEICGLPDPDGYWCSACGAYTCENCGDYSRHGEWLCEDCLGEEE